MRPILAAAGPLILLAAVSVALSGCIVYDVASTTVGAATTVAGAGVDAAGAVVGGAAGAVSGSDHDKKAD